MSAVGKLAKEPIIINFPAIDKESKIAIMLDDRQYHSKPQNIGSIKNRLGLSSPFTGAVEEIAHKQAQGHSISPAVLEGGSKAVNWRSQQLFGVDIDNKGDKILTLKKFLNRCDKFGILPVYIIATFSDTEQLPKYRAYFLCESKIIDADICKQIYSAFLSMFPEADHSCKNLERVFYGGKKLLYENYSSTFSVDELLAKSKPKSSKTTDVNLDNSELRKLAFTYPFLEYIRSTGNYEETNFDGRIGFNPCPLCGHNDDFRYYPETNTFCCYSDSGGARGDIIRFLEAQHSISTKEAIRLFKEMCGYDTRPILQRDTSYLKGITSDSIMYGENGVANDMSEIGLARAFADMYKDELCYTGEFGWVIYDGKKWNKFYKEDAPAKKLFVDFENNLLSDVLTTINNNPTDKSLDDDLKWTKKTIRTNKAVNGALSLAKSYLRMDYMLFDANPYDLNTPVGIADLRTGKIRPHDPKAYCTNITSVAPNKDDTDGKKQWLGFLKLVTKNDKHFAKYLKSIAGMAAIGKVLHEGVIFSYGTGANGKSTLWNTIHSALGTYATTMASEVLMTAKHNNQTAPALAGVQGKRLVLVSETEEGNRISGSVLKRLSSTDHISAKRLYLDPFEFTPIHTLVLSTNFLPKIGSIDDGTWRRILVAPFKAKIPLIERKSNYAERLLENAGGYILHWIIRGAMVFLKTDGEFIKYPPKVVQDATSKYRAE